MAHQDVIETLTPAQADDLVAYRSECLRVSRSCAPGDRQETARVLCAMYQSIGYSEPSIQWCAGPFSGARLRANRIKGPDKNPVLHFRERLFHVLRENLSRHLSRDLRENLLENLNGYLVGTVGVVSARIWGHLIDRLGEDIARDLSWTYWGQHEPWWQAYYAWPDRALRQMHTDEQREQLGWWITLSASCGWWQPFRDVVYVCDRPLRLAVDADGRLHHETLPAYEGRDGWRFFAWHGVIVPAVVIEHPDRISVGQVRAEPNAEIRRVMIERRGWGWYLETIGAQPVQTDRFGHLYRTVLDGERIGVVVVTNSTPEPDGSLKRYALLVPPEHETAHGAVASTFGLTAAQYAPVRET